MADYIRRDIVLQIINTVNDTGGFTGYADYCTLFDEVDTMPAADVQPVRRGHWIEKSEEYYRLWQDSGRSWDDMPYFVTGLKFACSCCFNQYDVNAEGVEEWDFCPKCGADMRGDENGTKT